jgi:hypothetical protein
VPLRHGFIALALVVFGALAGLAGPGPAGAQEPATQFVGPTRILFQDADSVFLRRAAEWNSASIADREKLLLVSLRMEYWKDHLPPDMREVYETLGYPIGRVLRTPVGHVEEWWYYGVLDPPLRFRDGELLDPDRLEALLSR